VEVEINGRLWMLGDRIGSGGFGTVYVAQSDGEEAAAKLIPKDPGAARELIVGDDLSSAENILPVYGTGALQDHLVILMPRAERSLRDLVNIQGGTLTQELAIPILLDVAQALDSLTQGGVVHRDLKPENILLHDGHWCLADFGLARYAEATTATHTSKGRATPEYAAPEQWRLERATPATDVYAFGVTAHELLAGTRPFIGPDQHDFRRQHLEEQPPDLPRTIDPRLRTIIAACLIKAPQARPTPERLRRVLESQTQGQIPTGGAAALIEANRAEVQRISDAARRESAAQTERARRDGLFEASRELFLGVERHLLEFVRTHAPQARCEQWPVSFGQARLDLSVPKDLVSTTGLSFDVIAHCQISIDQQQIRAGGYQGRSHSLWYCDAQREGEYGWFETAFMSHPLRPTVVPPRNADHRPFALAPNDPGVAEALSNPGSIGTYMVAWRFTMLVDDALEEFTDRWANWLAMASGGLLARPQEMPEHKDATGTWGR
jgi:serine/threonine-protein kinase